MRRGKNKRRNKDKARWATAGGTWKRREKCYRKREGRRAKMYAWMKCEFHSKRAFVAMAGCGLYKWACDKRQRPYAANARGRFRVFCLLSALSRGYIWLQEI